MIFDSVYDTYRGVVTYVRVIDGHLNPREKIVMMSTRATHELLEIGVISPGAASPTKGLGVGEVGYLITGVKDVRQSKVGDTVTNASQAGGRGARRRTATPSRWCSRACTRSTAPTTRCCATPWTSSSSTTPRSTTSRRRRSRSGFGFRVGFLGLLHLEIVRERLEREFDLDLISTAPNVVYEVTLEDRTVVTVTNPSEFPGGKIGEVREPVVRATILCPREFIGAIMELCQTERGDLHGMDYLSEDRVEMRYTLPLAEIVFDFFDQLKSKTRGYASPRLRARPATRPPTW